MIFKVYSILVHGSMILILALVVLNVIGRLAEGKRLIAKCHSLIKAKSYVTGRLVNNRNTRLGKRIKHDDKYIHYATYAYTVKGTEYTIDKRYKTGRLSDVIPTDPAIYYEPDNPAKAYIEGEPDAYTAGNAVKTFFKAALLLGLYWIFFFAFLPGIPAIDNLLNP